MVVSYLASQVSHGVDAIQLFDSWVGCLSPTDYETYVAAYTKEIMSSLDGRVPRIHFCANSASLLEHFVGTGADVLSVDWRIRSRTHGARRGPRRDPGESGPSPRTLGRGAMRRGGTEDPEPSAGHRGHVFSLGHGVLRETPPENLRR